MHLNASMIYDIVMLLVFLYIVWRGWRQGMVSELLRLAGWGAALVLVAVYSAPWAEKVYHAVVEARAVQAVAAAIPADVTAALESGAAAVESLQSVLDSLGGLLGGQLIAPESAATIFALFQQDAGSLAQIVTQTILQPMLISVVQLVLSILMLVVCLSISRGLARLAAAGGRGGFLSFTNRLLGLVLGIGEGLVTAYVYVFILSLLAMFVTTDWLSQDILHKTIFVRLFL